MILKNFCLPLILAMVAFTGTAQATKTITSPYVTEGRATMEWRGGLETSDDKRDVFKTRNQFAYGFTNFYEMKLSADTRDDNQGTFSDFDIENKFQILPKDEYFLDLGLRLDYARSLNGSVDEIGTKILLAKQMGDFSHLLNLEAGIEVGEDSSDEWGYGIAYGVAYPVLDDLSIGGEWYSDFGDFAEDFDDQNHMAGPVLYGTALDKIKYQAGILAGISDAAPDAMLKATVGYSFNF